MKPTEESLQTAAQCWCDPETENRVMDEALAVAFAKRLDEAKKITTPQAVEHLSKALKTDPGYWTSWQANIAMAFVDCARWAKEKGKSTELHDVANDAANYFLGNLTMDRSEKAAT